MKAKEKTVLGIDIDEHELRVVQLRTKGGKATLVDAISVPLPSGSVYKGIVRQPGNVAVALDRLLDVHKISCRRAVIGMCSDTAFLRTLAVPPVPEEELPVVVSGEVNHYQVIRSRNGVYSFFPLRESRDASEPAAHVALFGTEEDSPRGLRDLGDRVGLDILALEPTSLALLRLALQDKAVTADNLLVVMIENSTTDLAYVRKGKIVFFRRLDIGASAVMQKEDMAREHAIAGSRIEEPALDISSDIINDLSLDIRRSIDYLGREYKEDGQVGQVLISLRHVGGEALVEKLQEEITTPISLVGGHTKGESGERIATRFSGAIGLALRDAPEAANLIPFVDLFSAERSEYQLQTKQRNVVGSMAVSALSLVGGVVGFVLFSTMANTIEGSVDKTTVNVIALRKEVDGEKNAELVHATSLAELRNMSIPTDLAVDAVAQSLRPSVYLDSMKLTKNKVDLTLRAAAETEMIATVDRLTASPMMKQVAFGSFERAKEKGRSGLSFNVGAEVRPLGELEGLK